MGYREELELIYSELADKVKKALLECESEAKKAI